MKRRILSLFSAAAVLLLWGCYPQGPDYAEELDIAVATHKAEYDFTAKSTYAMPTKIVKITGNMIEGEDPAFIPDAAAAKILAQVDKNMTALGWTKVDISANPDMVLLPAAWETTTIYYYYDYWYWWYGGYYPGWGWGGYYPPVYYDSYSTGTLVMSLVDKSVVGSNGNPVTQWTGAINGVLTGTYNATRLTTAIDKVFSISPYLNTK